MQSKLGWHTVLFLSFMLLLDLEMMPGLAQGRGSGRSRDAGSPNAAEGIGDPAPVSNESREIGRTRPAEPVITPIPKYPKEIHHTDPKPPLPSAESAPPPPRHPIPQRRIPEDRSPQVIIVKEGGICGGGGSIGPPSQPEGCWIQEAISFGKDVTLAESHWLPDYSGFDFSEMLKRPFDHPFADIFVEQEEGGLVMRVWEDTEIMDIGLVRVPVDAIYVPRMNWFQSHSARLFIGHEYVVRTWDHHYAKFHVTGLLDDRVSFDWAYQYAEESFWLRTMAVTRDLSQGKFRP